MKKKDYRKILKEERHITYRNAWHLGCITCYFVMILFITTLLVFLNKLPIKPFFVIYILTALFVAIPTIIIDQLNDKQMRDGMKYYEENHQTKEGIDYIAYLITIEFISFMFLIISTCVIYFRFLKYDYRDILLGDFSAVRANQTDINNSLTMYVPKVLKTTNKDIKYKPDDLEYSITYNKDDINIGVYFTDKDIKESELGNYTSSVKYYYSESDDLDISEDVNSISFTKDNKYYLIAYYSYKDKLVQITYSCNEENMNKWEQGFITINNNIDFV